MRPRPRSFAGSQICVRSTRGLKRRQFPLSQAGSTNPLTSVRISLELSGVYEKMAGARLSLIGRSIRSCASDSKKTAGFCQRGNMVTSVAEEHLDHRQPPEIMACRIVFGHADAAVHLYGFLPDQSR